MSLPALAQWAMQFTPQVATAGGDTLRLDLAGVPHLFGGLDGLLTRIRTALAGIGISARDGLGHTPIAAERIAWHGIDARALFDTHGTVQQPAFLRLLGSLPIAGPGIDEDDARRLQRMGFATLGDLLALPRAALDRRLGRATGHWLDRLTGAQPDPQALIAPTREFVTAREFSWSTSNATLLHQPLQQMLDELAAFLRLHQQATQRIDWQFLHGCGRQTRSALVIVTTRPEMSAARWHALTRLRLENFRLPAPVDAVQLHCRQFMPLALLPASLFPELAAQQQRDDAVLDLLDRLRARLGGQACRYWAGSDSHRPEHQSRAEDSTVRGVPIGRMASSPQDQQPPRREPRGERAMPAMNPIRRAAPSPRSRQHHPLWLLPSPAPVTLTRDKRLHWHGALTLLGSVERVQAEWWSEQPLARDYWLAQRSDGVLLWIFRNVDDGRWYAHGICG